MKVLIAGAGNMGKTYIRSFITSRFIRAEDMFVLDRKELDKIEVPEIPKANVFNEPGEYIRGTDIIILAVKPQDFPILATRIKPYLHSSQLVVSIMAGIKIGAMSDLLGVDKIVRAMPNLPAQIGMSMTVFTESAAIDRKELFIIQNLINTTGKSVYVEDESMIDAATAISGSGPAYVYYFMDAMINAAVHMGFNEAQAELLVNQTLMGAVHLHNKSNYTCQEWIKKVASKGGTTEAALNTFNANSVNEHIQSALFSALNRAKELGK